MSILGALSWRGPLASMYIAGATDGPVFLTYLKRVLVPRLWKGAVVVMDNLGAHKVKGVQAQIEAAGARLALPAALLGRPQPHRTGLEPVQKLPARQAARTKPALARAIREGLARIRAQDAQHYFAHCGYS